MVINLCLPQFKPRIHCNKISADGYEVENLVSEDPVKRHRGFRCEYFIKPPVHVTISFPFNVEICRINIDTSSGSCHNITGLDIYTATSSNKACWNSPEPLFSAPSSQHPALDKETFTLVGKAVLKNQSKVTFGHRGFRPRPPFHHQTDPLLSFPGSASLDLWNKGPTSLNSVSHLKICITYVAGSGLPSIKRVEVWGQPAKSCSHEVVDDVLQVATKPSLDASEGQLPALPLPMESDVMPFGHSDHQERKLVEVLQDIPEEFLDPITLEIMTLPMLLPSGKVIDQGTLEKCNRSEATWGRVPSDPFTGVAFSPHSQPLPHPSLKARIDHFLLQHNIPGVNLLGRSRASGTVVASSLAMSSLKRKIDLVDQNQEGGSESGHFPSVDFAVASSLGFHAKRVKMEWDLNSSQMDCSSEASTHEQRLSESLDSALNSALSTMPFAASLAKGGQHMHSSSSSSSDFCGAGGAHEHNRSIGPQGCSTCSRAFSSYFKTEAVYQLPCRHLVCRACLADQQKSLSILCMNCKRLFATHDISRVHF
ncbi:RING finger protein 37 isoform X1 [Pantherophis guttatus]|uniref:RING finger protein 37 isoform X1 n=1 Tax=Pantherophis guttatus TaxID=94885 RepID=A0A6P9AUP6_PANGU|nr:RING finger protein 37 isoform X1 [Pantherophis guttatus]